MSRTAEVKVTLTGQLFSGEDAAKLASALYHEGFCHLKSRLPVEEIEALEAISKAVADGAALEYVVPEVENGYIGSLEKAVEQAGMCLVADRGPGEGIEPERRQRSLGHTRWGTVPLWQGKPMISAEAVLEAVESGKEQELRWIADMAREATGVHLPKTITADPQVAAEIQAEIARLQAEQAEEASLPRI